MALPFAEPPQNLCILRLSAVGDICHTLPVVRTIQSVWPQTRLTWIIGKTEVGLVGDISSIEFIVFDKSHGWRAYTDLKKQLRGRRFSALLHMQMSLRSSALNRLVSTPIRVGFDRARAKDLQWLFNNHEIPAHSNQHVMDSLFGFAEALGIRERVLKWDIPIPQADRQFVDRQVQTRLPYLVISPCSSMMYRNWNPEGYAAVGDYARQKHGLSVILSGGPSDFERRFGGDIEPLMTQKPLNLIGKTNLKQLLHLLDRAEALLSPDSGPAHMATAVNTPVIGLYACTNPDRARPYFSAGTTINRYPDAVLAKYGKPVSELPWGIRVRDAGTMDRITVDEVVAKLDHLMEK
jgi:heptosyltransferase I